MSEMQHPLAPVDVSPHFAGADGGDSLFAVTVISVPALILLFGIACFTLHALPERMAHKGNSAQLGLISRLAMLALFTHKNLFWIVARVLATFRPPDLVSLVLRPAGILVPSKAGRNRFQAGVPQVSAQVVKADGGAEIMCVSKPFTGIPMGITEVQDVIAAGRVRSSDRLGDAQNMGAPGTSTAFPEPIYPDRTDDTPPGSRCLAKAYIYNPALLQGPELGFGRRIVLHVVDRVGAVHAAGLRIRSLLLPLQTLVFRGH